MQWDSRGQKRWQKRWNRGNNWHKWFAWYPVEIDGRVYWLECLERKRAYGWAGCYWEYRP